MNDLLPVKLCWIKNEDNRHSDDACNLGRYCGIDKKATLV